jgi:hypothetical protein
LSDVASVESFLSKNGIKFKTLRHVATPTNDEMINTVKFDGEYKDTLLAK